MYVPKLGIHGLVHLRNKKSQSAPLSVRAVLLLDKAQRTRSLNLLHPLPPHKRKYVLHIRDFVYLFIVYAHTFRHIHDNINVMYIISILYGKQGQLSFQSCSSRYFAFGGQKISLTVAAAILQSHSRDIWLWFKKRNEKKNDLRILFYQCFS